MATFESSAQGLRVAGASTSERDLVESITRHGKEEGALLQRYEHFAWEAPSPVTRYLVHLILEEEHRHHQVLAEIAHTIVWGNLNSVEPALPRMVVGVGDDEIVAQTKELLASEKKDRADLRRLRRRLRSYTGTIWPFLIDLMLADTDKHTRILRYILRNRPG